MGVRVKIVINVAIIVILFLMPILGFLLPLYFVGIVFFKLSTTIGVPIIVGSKGIAIASGIMAGMVVVIVSRTLDSLYAVTKKAIKEPYNFKKEGIGISKWLGCVKRLPLRDRVDYIMHIEWYVCSIVGVWLLCLTAVVFIIKCLI